jgi:hypothetical protein
MTRLRLRVAERLKGAQNTYAMLTTFNEVDMSGLMDMRSTYKVIPCHIVMLLCGGDARGRHVRVCVCVWTE